MGSSFKCFYRFHNLLRADFDACFGKMNVVIADIFFDICGNGGIEIVDHNAVFTENPCDMLVITLNGFVVVVGLLRIDGSCGGENDLIGIGLQNLKDSKHGVGIFLDGGEITVSEEIVHVPEAVVPVDNIGASQGILLFPKHTQGVFGEAAVFFRLPNGVIFSEKLGHLGSVTDAANGIAE